MATLLHHPLPISRVSHRRRAPPSPPPPSSLSYCAFSSEPLLPTRSKGRLGMDMAVARGVVCMAKPRRVKMVAKQIQREISHMLLTDTILQHAILPESSLGADRFLSSLTTISDVEVSGDLQVVKVYVSVFGDQRGREVAIAGLKSKARYVRGELGRRMKLRVTPEIRFIEDESMERGSRVSYADSRFVKVSTKYLHENLNIYYAFQNYVLVIAILDKLKEERENNMSSPKEQGSDKDNCGDELEDKEWDGDDTDEGIIYVK